MCMQCHACYADNAMLYRLDGACLAKHVRQCMLCRAWCEVKKATLPSHLLAYKASCVSTVVEHPPRHLKAEGSIPAVAINTCKE
jgi:hypothetical protein